jgi:signal peptidase II
MTGEAAPANTERAAALRRLAPWLALAAAVLAVDQLSKALVQQWLAPGEVSALTGCFNFVLAYNRGAAFSFLDTGGGWQGYLFTGIALAASAVIARLLARPGNRVLFSIALGLIMGGALGNAVDRVRYGHVVDFLDFHWPWLEPLFAGGHFPAFNVADSAITVGVALLLLDEVLHLRRES